MKLVDGLVRWLPIVVAACTFVLMYVLMQFDSLIHKTLYGYGLQYSLTWASPYWTLTNIAWAMTGLIVALALVSQAYAIMRKAPTAESSAQTEVREEDRWSTFRLGDGSTIKVKLVVKGAKRLNKYSSDGLPVYTVDTEPVVQVVDVPESLRVAAPT